MHVSKEAAARAALLIGSATLIAGLAAPRLGFAADHLDAPGLESPKARPDADINDLYVFNSPTKAGRTVVAMTTGPGAGAIAPLTYATNVTYKINVDTNGDAIEDVAFGVRFGAAKNPAAPRQAFTITRYTGAGATTLAGGKVVAKGTTNRPPAAVTGGGIAWAGVRSDPFFFDLDAFRQVVLKQDRGRTGFCDKNGQGVDFFAALNTNVITLEVPNASLGGKIGVWAQTIGADKTMIDQMGRPAINAVFNKAEDKNAFNATVPSEQAAKFAKNVSDTLTAFSALDKEGAYAPDTVKALTGVLIPDVVTFDTATKAAGPLNGRALTDDVIDAELNIVTGGFGAGRDATGAIPSDCVAAHTDLSPTFPYLGEPHKA